jgi:signal transduction histidine kinase
MAGEVLAGPHEPTGPRPLFRSRTRLLAFAGTFAFFLIVQLIAVFVMHSAARRALAEVLARETAGAAASGASALGMAMERGSNPDELSSMIRRIRESKKLDDAFLAGPGRVDDVARTTRRNATVVAGARQGCSGVPVSALAATPRVVRYVLETGEATSERHVFMDDEFTRAYQPVVVSGAVRAVLVLEAHDPSAEALSALDWPLLAGLSASALSALLLAVAALGLMRWLDRTRRDVARMDRLATAGEFAASLAHEVKNPMGVILSAAQFLAERPNMTGEDRVLLGQIADEVRRAEGQIDSFLDLSRDTPLKKSREDLVPIVGGTLDLLEPKAGAANVEIVRELPDGPLYAMLDKRKVRQVLMNLLLNAVEAMSGSGALRQAPLDSAPLGGARDRRGRQDAAVVSSSNGSGGRMTVSLVAGDGFAELAVADDGPGMRAEALQLALEPFYTTKHTGTGLGLPQARNIVEKHGWKLLLESAPGEGTTVSIRLPIDAGGAP